MSVLNMRPLVPLVRENKVRLVKVRDQTRARGRYTSSIMRSFLAIMSGAALSVHKSRLGISMSLHQLCPFDHP